MVDIVLTQFGLLDHEAIIVVFMNCILVDRSLHVRSVSMTESYDRYQSE